MRPQTRQVVLGAALAALLAHPATARQQPAPSTSPIRLRAGTVQPDHATLDQATAPPGLTLLTFRAPVARRQRDALHAAGARVLGYIPTNTLLTDLSDPHALDALEDLPGLVALTPYQPEWKVDPSLWTDPEPEVLIHLLPGAAAKPLADHLRTHDDATFEGATLLRDAPVLTATLPPDLLHELCNRPDVRFIEPAPAFTLRNSSTRWIVQSNTPDHTPVYDAGITGAGQVLGIMDTKVNPDHCAFFDPDNPIGPDHRKILAYNTTTGANSHGTHVAGTALGDAGAFDDTRGVAYHARLVYSFIPNAVDLLSRLELHHQQGARVHSNSWGDDQTKAYNLVSRSIDLFSWENDTDLVVFSTSNFDEVTNPENAKNCLAVGATLDANAFFMGQDWHCFGGAGPTLDGRRKPEIFAPGCDTMSADAFTACGVTPLSGTSMATPAVAASALLARQYFTDGYYPTGAPVDEDALLPTGPLLKAVLVGAAEDMAFYPDSPSYPSFEEGWGHLVLDNSLYFQGDTRRLIVRQARNNSPEALHTGDTITIDVEVLTSDEPLAITLAWHDYPAEIDAALTPVNNLDLTALSPSFDQFKGNVFDTTEGFSVPGGNHDTLNNLEHIFVPSPHPGTWTITIDASAVNMGAQGYGLAVSGDVDQFLPCPADFNDDGAVDVRDFADLKAAYDAGLPSADVNADGQLNIFDFITFQQLFTTGCG